MHDKSGSVTPCIYKYNANNITNQNYNLQVYNRLKIEPARNITIFDQKYIFLPKILTSFYITYF